jgi:hypothetical protein
MLKRLVPLVLALIFALPVVSHASSTDILELEEAQMDAIRDHCAGVMHKRLNAGRVGAWRDLFNMSKSYADGCAPIEDRFLLSRAYEDMAYALLMLKDPQQALRWAQACLDANGQAVGCYIRKAEILLNTNKIMEARASVARGIMVGEMAIGMTKIEMERVRQVKPDLRAESIYRKRWYRNWERLDLRLSNLEESLSSIKGLQDDMDAQAQ